MNGDPTFCQIMKMIWAQEARWSGDRLPRPRRTKETAMSWTRGWKETTSWKPGAVDKTASGDRQSSQKWTKESDKDSRRKT